jgi:hypothetical protein
MPVTWQALPRTTAGNQFTVLFKKHLNPIRGAEIGKLPK